MSVGSLEVANFFVEHSINESRIHERITPMKLLKMIYMAHGLYLAKYDAPLIKEDIIAWRYGPVVENVYKAFRHYGNNPIESLAINKKSGEPYKIDISPDNENILNLLQAVWDSCLEHSAIQLSNWSHEQDSPWDITYNQSRNGNSGTRPISNKAIKAYFRKAA